MDEVVLPAEEDMHGVVHAIRRDARCAIGVARIVEIPLASMVRGERCCASCVPPSLGPGGATSDAVLNNTRLLRIAVDDSADACDRVVAATLVLWGDYSRFIPRPVFSRLRSTYLLPLLETAGGGRPLPGAPGPLVAFTAGDMRRGREENPVLYDTYARGAARSLLHASPHGGVWLLHDPLHGENPPMWPPLGRVLEPVARPEEIDLAACEVFGVLADDALAGSGSWEDLPDWWTAAKRLA